MSDWVVWAAILLVAGMTFASRMAGPLLMTHVGDSPKLRRFLDGLSVSVVSALIAFVVAQAGPREAAAVGAAAVLMVLTRSAVWSMIAGMALAASWTALHAG